MLDFNEWMALPPVDWMNAAFPARTDWVVLGSAYIEIGGDSSFSSNGERWYLTVMCPWELRLGDEIVISDEAETVLPENALVDVLVGAEMLKVEAESDGDLPVFNFSTGHQLFVYPDGIVESYYIGLRGSVFPYVGPTTRETGDSGAS